MRSFENIDTVIRDIVRLDKYDYADTAVAIKRAFNEMYEMSLIDAGIKYFNFIKSEFVTIKDNLTVDLPKDCEKVIKVGYLFNDLGRNEIRYLGERRFIHRKDLAQSKIVYPACECTEDTADSIISSVNTSLQSADLTEALIFHNMFVNGTFGELYGFIPQMYPNGVYSVDFENNRLVLDAGSDIVVGNELVIEYKSSITGDTYKYIPKIAFDGLRYKALSYLTDNVNAAELYRINFNKEIRKIRSAAHPITLDDLMQVCSGRIRFRS